MQCEACVTDTGPGQAMSPVLGSGTGEGRGNGTLQLGHRLVTCVELDVQDCKRGNFKQKYFYIELKKVEITSNPLKISIK